VNGRFEDDLTTDRVTGLLNATDVQLEYLRLQPPDEDGCNIVVSVPVVNPSPLTVNSVSCLFNVRPYWPNNRAGC
jgi:hypothetical protein